MGSAFGLPSSCQFSAPSTFQDGVGHKSAHMAALFNLRQTTSQRALTRGTSNGRGTDTAHDQRLSSQVLNLRPTLDIHSCFKQNLAIAETVPVPSIFCNMFNFIFLETDTEIHNLMDLMENCLTN